MRTASRIVGSTRHPSSEKFAQSLSALGVASAAVSSSVADGVAARQSARVSWLPKVYAGCEAPCTAVMNVNGLHVIRSAAIECVCAFDRSKTHPRT